MMPRRLLCLLAALLLAVPLVRAQEPLPLTEEDYSQLSARKGLRQGISILPFPIMSYSQDLGFQFGAFAELYDYGTQPSIYPDFFHYFHLEASHYTKGQTFLHGEYDSSFVIPGVRMILSASWQYDPLYQFYGFNGVSRYDPALDRTDGNAFYCYQRSMIRGMASFQGGIYGDFKWLGTLTYRYLSSGDFDFGGYDNTNTLFRQYRQAGIIKDDELKGSMLEILGGIRYDSRDFEKDPRKGIWAEFFLNGSPDFFGTGYPYLKAALRWRHYITPGPRWFTLAYHLGYQTTLAGNVPFYVEQNISTIQIRQTCAEGLGGINTLRGVLGNRLVGDGYAWGNLELRFRVLELELLGLNLSFGLNPFYDLGVITKPFRPAETAAMLSISGDELLSRTRQLHQSAGIGFNFGLEANTMLSVEWARAFNNDDGRSSIYFAMNYVF